MAADSDVGIALVRPELLGTYGDGGNATVLARRLEWRGIGARVLVLAAGDTVPESAGVCVLGGGEDAAQAALADDGALGRSLAAAVDRGAAVLAVCAGMQVMGHSFAGPTGALRPGFGLLDVVTDRRLPKRATGEIVADPDPSFGLPALTGFENHGGATRVGDGAVPLGRVVHGVGNGDGAEGAVSGHVVGTYLHGPVLARNPALADLLLSWVVGELAPLDVPAVDRLRAERLTAAARGGRRRLVRRR